jgi:hypothetical protein
VRPAGAAKRDPEQADVFNVPETLRAPGQPAVTQHVRFYALDDVFPGAGLGAAFDSDASFRAALHQVGGALWFLLRGCANGWLGGA